MSNFPSGVYGAVLTVVRDAIYIDINEDDRHELVRVLPSTQLRCGEQLEIEMPLFRDLDWYDDYVAVWLKRDDEPYRLHDAFRVGEVGGKWFRLTGGYRPGRQLPEWLVRQVEESVCPDNGVSA